jgi:proteasome lid subunit RPN8/RPN11
MTESGTDSTTLTWSVPECPFTIESSARVLDDIRLAVMDAFFSLPRGGAEIGGILIGKFDQSRLVITDYAALDCEHAYGPSFNLSPPDEGRLRALLAAHANDPGNVRPVGWYHSHTRSEIFLSDADLKIHQDFFPQPWQVALVMKPHTLQPARIGFFFRAADGSVHANAPYREDLLDALPIRQMPAGAPSAPGANDQSARRFRQDRQYPVSSPEPMPAPAAATAPPVRVPAPEPIPAPVVIPVPAPEYASVPPAPTVIEAAEPLPEPAAAQMSAPRFLIDNPASGRRWMVVGIGAVAILGILGAAFRVRQMWLPRTLTAMQPVVAAIRPAPAVVTPAPAPPPILPALKLSTLDREGQLQITWDRNSPVVQHATDAVLEINEGGPSLTAIQLDAAHLQAGSFTYARTAEKVDVKLVVHQDKGPDLREVTSFLGKLPERQPVEDPVARQQREEMAKQAAKLKADLTFQAAKTKKLERDVKSMRDEMRLQQLRRLKNQAPDK